MPEPVRVGLGLEGSGACGSGYRGSGGVSFLIKPETPKP